MKCPHDGAPLAVSERDGIAVHRCPDCRGVWLGREDVDMLIARADTQESPPPLTYEQHPAFQQEEAQQDFTLHPERKRRKDNWLSDLLG